MSILKSFDSEHSKPKINSSKLFVMIGVVLLAVIGITVAVNKVKNSSGGFNPVAILGTKTKAPTFDTSGILAAAQKQTATLGQQAAKIGQDVGAAVLGETVKVVQKTASESASTAATLVIRNAVPALVDQINKLPEAQKKEVQKLVCQ